MSKTLKRAMTLIAIVVLTIAFAGYYVLGNLDRLVEAAIERVGPRVTGTPVLVGSVSIDLKEGRGEINGLTIGNPDGFRSDYALKLGRILLDIDTATLTSDPVRISEITVSDAHLIAEVGAGGTNLKTLMDKLKSDESAADGAGGKASSSGPGLVIERFAFTDAGMTLETPLKDYETTVPDVKLSGIGEKENGATAAEAAEQLLKPVIAAAIKAAQDEAGIQGLDGYKQGAMDKAREEAGKATDKLKDALGLGN